MFITFHHRKRKGTYKKSVVMLRKYSQSLCFFVSMVKNNQNIIITNNKQLDQTCKHTSLNHLLCRFAHSFFYPPTACPSSISLPSISIFYWLPLCLVGLYCKFFSKWQDPPFPVFFPPASKGISNLQNSVAMLPKCVSPGVVSPLQTSLEEHPWRCSSDWNKITPVHSHHAPSYHQQIPVACREPLRLLSVMFKAPLHLNLLLSVSQQDPWIQQL